MDFFFCNLSAIKGLSTTNCYSSYQIMPITALFSLAYLSSVSAIVTLAAGYMKQLSIVEHETFRKKKPCKEIIKIDRLIIMLTVHKSK